MLDKHPIFSQYAHDFIASQKEVVPALVDHLQIPVIIDMLSRKENHHILLAGTHSEKIYTALLEGIAARLSDNQIPRSLNGARLIYLDVKSLTALDKSIDLLAFFEMLESTQANIILVVNQMDDGILGKRIHSLLANPQYRIVLIANQKHQEGFVTLALTEPTETQLLSVLKSYRAELEDYHHVAIPDETFASALSMAKHYLPSYSWFDKAFELLDSASARASVVEGHDSSLPFRPAVTRAELAFVVSNYTRIPITHLNNNAFQLPKFVEAVQRRVFGQEAAITMIGSVLQHACIKLQEKPGPLCSFLLAGPAETGKMTVALAMAEHLFGHKDALIRVNLNEACHSIADIKILSEENSSTSLLSAIRQTPYAVILMENIQQWPAATFNLFKHIFMHGFAIDNDGNKYDFSHAIFVVTTTLGADRIATLTQAPPVHEANKTLDLMQLVLSDHSQNADYQIQNMSSRELCEELIPMLEGYFSTTLLQYLNIIPFVPIDYLALEKIIRLRVKLFAKRLETHFGIELNYAPEVIKFLAHEALWRKANIKPLEKLLEEYLYSAVANEILAHAEDKNRSKRLLLQLNDEGQVLRCEFMGAGASIYSIM